MALGPLILPVHQDSVPERPGLRVTLDREQLERLKKNTPPHQPPYILKNRFKNGTMMYSIMRQPETRHFMVLPNR